MLLVLSVTGCVRHPIGPASDDAAFADKARTTAEAALSSVETVRLLADTADDGNAFGNYVDVSLSEQEDTLDAVQSGFRSIQPPGPASDRVRDDVDSMLSSALDHVSAVRIAARRNGSDRLADVAAPLAADADALHHFIDQFAAGS